mmetsp:Transcript_21506/g.33426  ORF Transcript_21506/g.33426 Transcript_21506/m.33426 type:complete len:385 (-) Transcript_21506:31-1185(-)
MALPPQEEGFLPSMSNLLSLPLCCFEVSKEEGKREGEWNDLKIEGKPSTLLLYGKLKNESPEETERVARYTAQPILPSEKDLLVQPLRKNSLLSFCNLERGAEEVVTVVYFGHVASVTPGIEGKSVFFQDEDMLVTLSDFLEPFKNLIKSTTTRLFVLGCCRGLEVDGPIQLINRTIELRRGGLIGYVCGGKDGKRLIGNKLIPSPLSMKPWELRFLLQEVVLLRPQNQPFVNLWLDDDAVSALRERKGPSEDDVLEMAILSTFQECETWKKGTSVVNVIGSTNDPKNDGKTWLNLWKLKTNNNTVVYKKGHKDCSSFVSGYCDESGNGNLIGGHVVQGEKAVKLEKGADVWILPICSKHNSNDEVTMKLVKDVDVIKLVGFMQ